MMKHGLLTMMGALLLVAIECVAAGEGGRVDAIKVLPDKVADCSSLKSICDSVTRGCTTNDEKAIALYNFMRLAHYHRAYPREKGGVGALKEINVYGWSLCGGLHTVQAALWRQMGWKWRYVGWSKPGHTTTEVEYDGAWHYYDVFLKFYCWRPDANAPGGRTVASQADIRKNPSIVQKDLVFRKSLAVYYQKDNQYEMINGKPNWVAPAFLTCGDGVKGVVMGVNNNRINGSPTAWAGLKFDTPDYSTDINLAPGYTLELTWDRIDGCWYWAGQKNPPSHSCGDKDYRNSPSIGPILEPYAKDAEGKTATGKVRSYANGIITFAPDLSSSGFLKGLLASENVKSDAASLTPVDATRPASITFDLSGMPYVLVKATLEAGGAETVEVSTDGGKTFAAAPDKADLSKQVNGKYRCAVRVTFRKLTSLKAVGIVQLNRCALPYLSPGKNKVTVTVADPKQLGVNKLVVTYAFRPGDRYKSWEKMTTMGANVARAHYASWPKPVRVVRKVFGAGELPATFDIDITTRADRHPVYPRMLFLRREIITPEQQPSPLPAGALPPEATGELKTLPNPFLTGIARAPKKIERKVETKTIAATFSHVVSDDGKAETNHFIKTKKGEYWVALVSADLKTLPPVKQIAAARLVLPVVKTRSKANTKTAVVSLKAPFEKDKPYDFANFGDILGTLNLPPMPQPNDPPRIFKIDITGGIKAVAGGETGFNGFAVRTIPDRGVDDGHIVRVDLSKDVKTVIEVDVYADGK